MKIFLKGWMVLSVFALVFSIIMSSLDGGSEPVKMNGEEARAILGGNAEPDTWEYYYSIAQELGEACLDEDIKDFAMTNNEGWTDGKTVFSTITDRYTNSPTPTVMGTNAFDGLMMHFARKIVIKQRDGEFYAECVLVE